MKKPLVEIASIRALEQLLEDYMTGKSSGDEITKSPTLDTGADSADPIETGGAGSTRTPAGSQQGALYAVAGGSSAGRGGETAKTRGLQ